jgi:ADP-ribose pyrophosphatase YjhB (NUDIX family)
MTVIVRSSFAYCPVCGERLEDRYVVEEERDRLVCVGCGHILYVNPKVVAGTIPVADGRVWLLRRAIEPRVGAWTFPAGFMELGETVEEAAARETLEELHLKVKLGPLLNVYSRPEISTVHIIYLAEALSQPSLGKEALEFASFAPSEIPWDDLAFSTTRSALKDWVATLGSL